MVKEEKKLTLAEAKAFVNKSIEKGGVVNLDDEHAENVDAISTGAFMLDIATGIGGLPIGRLVEIYGEPSSGKTTATLSAMAEAQKKYGKPVLCLDYEHAIDPKYCRLLGVDLSKEKFILSQPDSFESGMKIAELYITNNLVSMVVFDSLAAMATEKELAGEPGDVHVAVLARAMSQELRRLTAAIHKSQVCVVFINHVHDVIETGFTAKLGIKRKTTPGGKALKFYSSMRIEMAKADAIKGKIQDPISGAFIDGFTTLKVKAVITKNKMASPFRIGYFYIHFGEGISEMRMAVDVLIARNVIGQHGTRFIVPSEITGGEPYSAAGFSKLLSYLGEGATKRNKAIEMAKGLAEGGKVEYESRVVVDGDDAGGGAEGEDPELGAASDAAHGKAD
jgi:recombination protein RecA